MRSVQITVAAALALTAIALGATLSRAPLTIAATNGIQSAERLAATNGDARACQAGEALPRGTTAIRLSLETAIGPPVTVQALAGGHLITHGAYGAGWPGASVTVPVARVSRTTPDATVCFTVGPSYKRVSMFGQHTAPALAAVAGGGPLPGRISIEYLTPGSRSWWSLASSVARHVGFGHAGGGTWIALLAAALALAVLALTSWLLIRELGARRPAASERASGGRRGRLAGLRAIPLSCWACALVAILNAACWSIVMPPFQVPDEPAHFAYVQQLAQTGRLPTSGEEDYSPEELAALSDLGSSEVSLRPQVTSISSQAQQQRLQRDLALPLGRRGGGGAGVAASEPPLYYALETIPYYLGSSGTLLDRLQLMRLLSALMAGLTALFAFLFIRETLPSTPWLASVGALGVALAPLLGEMSGGVNPDALLYAVSAALFYCLARAFRRGLTPRLAVALGAVTAAGLLTKVNFLGLIPGVILALAVLTVRARRRGGRDAGRALAAATAVAGSPLVVYVVVDALSSRAGLGVVSSAIAGTRRAGSVLGEIGYVWQLYLPPLPGMRHDFPGLLTIRQIWFDGYVGLFGWLDTTFPNWLYDVALVPAGLIAVLCIRALVAARAALSARAAELAVYVVLAIGLMALVGAASYLAFVGAGGALFEPRYLLPLSPLLGLALALAARGAGRRWAPTAGALIVMLFLAHDLFSQLQVVARYYG